VNVQVIAVPYDSGMREFRMGRGPGHLLQRGLAGHIAGCGHAAHVHSIEVDGSRPPAEIRTAFEIDRLVAERVRAAREEVALPVVLAGNCNTSLGTVSGLGAGEVGVIWFDSHGDLNTPETTRSGFLDGMALAALTGRCWSSLSMTIPGFQPVSEERVVLVGARELDPAEADSLQRSDIGQVHVSSIRSSGASQALAPMLDRLRGATRRLYVHVDLDVLDPSEGRANEFAAPVGLTAAEVCEAIAATGSELTIAGAAITAYDPAFDSEGGTSRAAFRIVEALLQAVR
jgi:arginase